MARNQKGITLMSFLVVLVIVGFFALIAMKLFPMYTEFQNLKGAMAQFAAQPNSGSLTLPQVQADLERRLDIAYVESVKKQHIKLVRAGRGSQLNISYEVRKPLMGNLDIVGKFDHTVDLNGTASGD